jgi:hypothetical protein
LICAILHRYLPKPAPKKECLKQTKSFRTAYAPKERKRKKVVKAVGHFFQAWVLCLGKKMNTPEGHGRDNLLERAIFA